MDETDRLILNRIQTDFPIEPRPFLNIAEALSLSEQDVIKRIRRLKKENIIRRIGGNFSPDRVGYNSTLCAAEVPPEKIDFFTDVVNAYPGVTHNYMRDHRYNIWFTFIAQSRQIIETNLREISSKTGIDNILNLPATSLFKISANFKV